MQALPHKAAVSLHCFACAVLLASGAVIVRWVLKYCCIMDGMLHYIVVQGLVKYIDNISDKDIPDVHIPTGIPMVYELDQNMKATHHYHLKDNDDE